MLSNHTDVDGIFAYGDTLAITTMKSLRKLGKKIGHAVKVVGFDNNYFSTISTPTLTTVEQSPSFMGKTAFNLIHKLRKNEESKNPHVITDVSLVERESSRK